MNALNSYLFALSLMDDNEIVTDFFLKDSVLVAEVDIFNKKDAK